MAVDEDLQRSLDLLAEKAKTMEPAAAVQAIRMAQQTSMEQHLKVLFEGIPATDRDFAHGFVSAAEELTSGSSLGVIYQLFAWRVDGEDDFAEMKRNLLRAALSRGVQHVTDEAEKHREWPFEHRFFLMLCPHCMITGNQLGLSYRLEGAKSNMEISFPQGVPRYPCGHDTVQSTQRIFDEGHERWNVGRVEVLLKG